MSVSAPFVRWCLSGSAVAPFPHPSGWPGGALTHWKAPPCHGAHVKRSLRIAAVKKEGKAGSTATSPPQAPSISPVAPRGLGPWRLARQRAASADERLAIKGGKHGGFNFTALAICCSGCVEPQLGRGGLGGPDVNQCSADR